MVLKPNAKTISNNYGFENDVKMYGTQTEVGGDYGKKRFENDVKMYGTQTLLAPYIVTSLFENDVKMYGTQTESLRMSFSHCLRMM